MPQFRLLLSAKRSWPVRLQTTQDPSKDFEGSGEFARDDHEVIAPRPEPALGSPHPLLDGGVQGLALAQRPLCLDIADGPAGELDPNVVNGIVRLQRHGRNLCRR